MSDVWDDMGPGDVSPPGSGGWVRQSGWGSRPDVPMYDERVLELRTAPEAEERPQPPAEPKPRPERHLRVVEPIQGEEPPAPAPHVRPTLFDRLGTPADFMRSFAAGHVARQRIEEDMQQRRAAADEKDRRRR